MDSLRKKLEFVAEKNNVFARIWGGEDGAAAPRHPGP